MVELSEKLALRLPYQYCNILSSADQPERYNGSSGGVVTTIAKYLFREGKIKSAVCYEFSGKSLFEPRIAHSEGDYHQTGSIYHHVPLIQFLRSNLESIQSPVFVT